MISALARSSEVFDDEEMLGMAIRSASFIQEHMYDAETDTLTRSYCAGPSTTSGFHEDYSFLIQGLLDLYEATFNEDWLSWAIKLQDRQDALFWDEEHGGYFNAPEGDEHLLLRLKDDQDGSEPAANSISASNLLRLYFMLDSQAYMDRAEALFHSFRRTLLAQPHAMPVMLKSLMLKEVSATLASAWCL